MTTAEPRFIPYRPARRPESEMLRRAHEFFELMNQRSVLIRDVVIEENQEQGRACCNAVGHSR
jgi:hypothetical protein